MHETLRYLIGKEGPSGFGSKSTAEHVIANLSFNSMTAIITGATSGIGAETARVLAKCGTRVVIPARNLNRAQDVKSRILRECPNAQIMVFEIDLGSLASIHSFATKFLSLDIPLNLLINNAGRFCPHFELSLDGFEATFATNYLGHFLLTKLLLRKMIETARMSGIQGRIVNVSSAIHSWISKKGASFDDIGDPKRYDATKAYALSKLANILHAKELASQLKKMNANVTANAVHPGVARTRITRGYNAFIIGTSSEPNVCYNLHGHALLIKKCFLLEKDSIFILMSKLMKTLPQAASTVCYVAMHPRLEGVSGKYFADCNETPTSSLAMNEDLAKHLWSITEPFIRCSSIHNS